MTNHAWRPEAGGQFKPFAADLLSRGASGLVVAYFTALGVELMGEADFLGLLSHSEWKDFGSIG